MIDMIELSDELFNLNLELSKIDFVNDVLHAELTELDDYNTSEYISKKTLMCVIARFETMASMMTDYLRSAETRLTAVIDRLDDVQKEGASDEK